MISKIEMEHRIDAEIERLENERAGPRMPFGVHTGVGVSDLPRNYVLWLLTQGLSKKHRVLFIALCERAIPILQAEVHEAKREEFNEGCERIARGDV